MPEDPRNSPGRRDVFRVCGIRSYLTGSGSIARPVQGVRGPRGWGRWWELGPQRPPQGERLPEAEKYLGLSPPISYQDTRGRSPGKCSPHRTEQGGAGDAYEGRQVHNQLLETGAAQKGWPQPPRLL